MNILPIRGLLELAHKFLPILLLVMRKVFLVGRGGVRRMPICLNIWTTQVMSGLWGSLLFLRFAHMDVDVTLKAKVHATINVGV